MALLCLASALCGADTFKVLHHFAGTDGATPSGCLALAGTNLYGTTRQGGSSNQGTIYSLNLDGSGFRVLKQFTGSDGNEPRGGLVCSGTTLYGTTLGGGTFTAGTIFRIETDGTAFQVLKSFNPSIGEGSYPAGAEPLVLSGSTLYGMTQGTGASNGVAFGWGTVFKIQTDGSNFVMLKNFPGSSESYPWSGLALDGDLLYGTTSGWATDNLGTVFKIKSDGSGYSVLWWFAGGSDAAFPLSGVAVSGNALFGTTYYGPNGQHYGGGTVFRVNKDGTGFQRLKAFGSPGCPIWWPRGGILCSNDVLYGTTIYGGPSGDSGGVYALTTDGAAFSILRQFRRETDGQTPEGLLTLSGRLLYGAAGSGGMSNKGTIYALSIPAPGIVRMSPTQTAEAGADITLSCAADGYLPITCKWMHNETNLIRAGTNLALRLTNLQPSHAGAYRVIVTNVFGSETSAPAHLAVIPPVPRRPVSGLLATGPVGSLLHLDETSSMQPAPSWTTFERMLLTNSPQWYFDTSSQLLPSRFYRAWQTNAPGPAPVLGLHLIPAITLTGNINDLMRLDAINAVGPTNAWFPLATITLTNTSQVHLDVSSLGQPPRLYRIVPLP